MAQLRRRMDAAQEVRNDRTCSLMIECVTHKRTHSIRRLWRSSAAVWLPLKRKCFFTEFFYYKRLKAMAQLRRRMAAAEEVRNELGKKQTETNPNDEPAAMVQLCCRIRYTDCFFTC